MRNKYITSALLLMMLMSYKVQASNAHSGSYFGYPEDQFDLYWKTFYVVDSTGNRKEKWVGLYGKNLLEYLETDKETASLQKSFKRYSWLKTNSLFLSLTLLASGAMIYPIKSKIGTPIMGCSIYAFLSFNIFNLFEGYKFYKLKKKSKLMKR
ncbi:MAG: hypothetical protein HQK83_14190 [Fibrobacteria bacterium]|nr:hypothetical protein [Fibrobacteria bacterium]